MAAAFKGGFYSAKEPPLRRDGGSLVVVSALSLALSHSKPDNQPNLLHCPVDFLLGESLRPHLGADDCQGLVQLRFVVVR